MRLTWRVVISSQGRSVGTWRDDRGSVSRTPTPTVDDFTETGNVHGDTVGAAIGPTFHQAISHVTATLCAVRTTVTFTKRKQVLNGYQSPLCFTQQAWWEDGVDRGGCCTMMIVLETSVSHPTTIHNAYTQNHYRLATVNTTTQLANTWRGASIIQLQQDYCINSSHVDIPKKQIFSFLHHQIKSYSINS